MKLKISLWPPMPKEEKKTYCLVMVNIQSKNLTFSLLIPNYWIIQRPTNENLYQNLKENFN